MKPPSLTSLSVEQQHFYSEVFLNVSLHHSVSKNIWRYPTKYILAACICYLFFSLPC